MLRIPEIGFNRSVRKPNVNPQIFGDWVEASALFGDGEIRKGDIVDVLLDSQVLYEDSQELAEEITQIGWDVVEMRKRCGCIPESLVTSQSLVKDTSNWDKWPVRSFLILLSLTTLYPEWASIDRNSTKQGDLFESVVEESCPALLPDWEVYRSGWSPENPINFDSMVKDICVRLNTNGPGNIKELTSSNVKDAGLDIVCYRNYSDLNEAFPVILLQCASGKNRKQKIYEPSAKLWGKLLNTAITPSTGMALPFVIDREGIKKIAEGNNIIFDRSRILSTMTERNIKLSDGLSSRLIKWMEQKIENLPI